VKKTLLLPGIVATVALTLMTAVGPVFADSRQQNKNLWRNLAIGGGVIALHGLLRHNSTEALLGAAGAAYSANRYEQDRRSQSRARDYQMRYHRRYYRSGRGYYVTHTRYYPRHHSYRHHSRRYMHHSSDPRVNFVSGNRKYYWFNGRQYFMNLNTGQRVLVS
jgi:hypothetical protein